MAACFAGSLPLWGTVLNQLQYREMIICDSSCYSDPYVVLEHGKC